MLMIFVICRLTSFEMNELRPMPSAFFAEFIVAPNEIADDGAVGQIKVRGVVTGFRGACRADMELRGEFEKSGGAQIAFVFVPNDDVIGRQARASRPRITASATAGRVPLSIPAVEKTLMPTTSCVETRLRQASATVVLPVKFVMPRLTIVCTEAVSGWKSWMAFESSTMTTSERVPAA